jgi:hypothetical protein
MIRHSTLVERRGAQFGGSELAVRDKCRSTGDNDRVVEMIMKRLIPLLFVLATAGAHPALAQSAQVQAAQVQSEADETTDVAAVLDSFHQAASDADGDEYFGLLTPTARFIGTDAGERWSVEDFRAYAMPYFSQGKGWTYHPRDRVISILPIECRCVASFDELLDNASYGETRGSGVLIRSAEGWKIDQYVLSFAVPNGVAKDVVNLIKAAPVEEAH